MKKNIVKTDGSGGLIRCRQGFTLTEIMIGLVLFGVAISGVTAALRQGRQMLFEAENKELAYSVAQSTLERYLAMSYGDLKKWITDNPQQPVLISDLGDQDSDTGCEITVTENAMATTVAKKATGRSDIPYCSIKVECDYKDQGVAKQVSLSGIIPYPYLQITTQTVENPIPAIIAEKNTDKQVLSYTFTPLVRSDLMVFYNLSIDVESTAVAIKGTDLLITQARIKNSKQNNTNIGIPTGTPVLTQPSIGNVIGVAADKIVPGEANMISLVWKKDSDGGNVKLKTANLIILQSENNK